MWKTVSSRKVLLEKSVCCLGRIRVEASYGGRDSNQYSALELWPSSSAMRAPASAQRPACSAVDQSLNFRYRGDVRRSVEVQPSPLGLQQELEQRFLRVQAVAGFGEDDRPRILKEVFAHLFAAMSE